MNPTSRLDSGLVRDLMERNLLPPTDSHLAAIAKSQGLSYTLGKRGAARWYSDDNKPIYPLYDGFYGSYGTETLKAGSVIVDRYGRDTGSFVSPQGTIFSERSLPPGSKNDEYHVYRVKKTLREYYLAALRRGLDKRAVAGSTNCQTGLWSYLIT